MMGSLVFKIPAAGQVQRGDDTKPNDINSKKIKSESFRSKPKSFAYSDIFTGIAHDKEYGDINNADEIKMKNIIKEWHAAVNNKYTREPVLYLFKPNKQQKAGTNRHAEIKQ